MLPSPLKAVTYFDAQNVFHQAKDRFGRINPDFNPIALSELVCRQRQWMLDQVRFYTGVPDPAKSPKWSQFWNRKLAALGRDNRVRVFSRMIRYRMRDFHAPDGTVYPYEVKEEKGVDVRLAIDLVVMTFRKEFDVAIIFSQDQDLNEATREAFSIAKQQNRRILLASAYPDHTSKQVFGISGTIQVPITKADWLSCLDTRNFFI